MKKKTYGALALTSLVVSLLSGMVVGLVDDELGMALKGAGVMWLVTGGPWTTFGYLDGDDDD